MTHCVILLGGMYGLASYDLTQNPIGKNRLEMAESINRSRHWLQLGAKITEICHESYDSTPTKLGPDVFQINNRGTSGGIIESGMFNTL